VPIRRSHVAMQTKSLSMAARSKVRDAILERVAIMLSGGRGDDCWIMRAVYKGRSSTKTGQSVP
jgi:hypothetical protein